MCKKASTLNQVLAKKYCRRWAPQEIKVGESVGTTVRWKGKNYMRGFSKPSLQSVANGGRRGGSPLSAVAAKTQILYRVFILTDIGYKADIKNEGICGRIHAGHEDGIGPKKTGKK